MKYEEIVSDVCGRNWRSVNKEEFQGGLGVAILLSYLKGIKPTIDDISKHLGVSSDDLWEPFQRLLYGGVFLKEFNARMDPELLANGISPTALTVENMTASDMTRNAWCHVAGIASGLIYINPNKPVTKVRKKNQKEDNGTVNSREKNS